jgi:hypothetical protein
MGHNTNPTAQLSTCITELNPMSRVPERGTSLRQRDVGHHSTIHSITTYSPIPCLPNQNPLRSPIRRHSPQRWPPRGSLHHGRDLRLHPHLAHPSRPPKGSIFVVACSVVSEAEANEDRISRLADVLLSNIVSRLPINDVARTTALVPRLGLHAARPRRLYRSFIMLC